jgi:hypothetical protein
MYRDILRWTLRLFLIAALLAGVLTFSTGWGCRLAMRLLRSSRPLRALPALTFRIQHLSLTGVEIADIQLGHEAGAPRIRRLEVRYSPRSLLAHTINSVSVDGLFCQFSAASNTLAFVGQSHIQRLFPANAASRPAGPPSWKLLELAATDLQVQMMTGDADTPSMLDCLSGTLRTQWNDGNAYHLSWGGDLLNVPSWLSGDVDLGSKSGRVSAAVPFVSSQRLRDLASQLRPGMKVPPIDGALSFSISADFTNALPQEVTVLAATRGVLSFASERVSLSLTDVLAGGQWQLGDGMPGRLRNVAVQATLAHLSGLPPLVSDALAAAHVEFRLAETTLTGHLKQPFGIQGQLSLPQCAKYAEAGRAEIDLDMAVSTTNLQFRAGMPTASGVVQQGEMSIPWRVGEASLQASAVRIDPGSGWEIAGEGSLVDVCAIHPDGLISNASVHVPFGGFLDLSRPESICFPIIHPRLNWERAQLSGLDLLITNCAATAAADTGILLESAVQISAAGSFLALDAKLELTDDGGIHAKVVQHTVRFTHEDVLFAGILARLAMPSASLEGLKFSGALGFEAECNVIAGAKPDWRCGASVDDLAVALTGEVNGEIAGIHTSVQLEGEGLRWQLQPVESVFTNALFAGIGVNGGRILWRMDRQALLIERAEFDWCGGKARLYAVRVDLKHPDVDFILYIDSMDAGELLRLIKPFDGTATGRLYGRLPLRICNRRVQLSEGFLYALPGERGNIRLRNASFIRDYLSRAGLPVVVQKNVADALGDLNYDVLRLDLSSTTAREAKLVMKLAGRAAHDPKLPPVDLDIRVNGPLEALLNFGLQMNNTQR